MPRKKLPKQEKKRIIQVFVKEKHHAKAKKRIAEIAREYNTESHNTEVRA